MTSTALALGEHTTSKSAAIAAARAHRATGADVRVLAETHLATVPGRGLRATTTYYVAAR